MPNMTPTHPWAIAHENIPGIVAVAPESKRVTRDDVAATFGMEQRELDEWFDALPDAPASGAEEVVGLVLEEFDRATGKFGAFNSTHEGYAVIQEELDELWDDVKANRLDAACAEAVQVAAMAIRFVVDLAVDR